MSSSATPVDPRLLELLSEVGKQNQSLLFDFERQTHTTACESHALELGQSAAGISASERELLALHRDEMAYLLRQLCLSSLADDPRARSVHAFSRPDPSILRQNAIAAAKVPVFFSASDTSIAIAAAVLRDVGSGVTDTTSLAVAALRLREQSNARVYLAYSALQEGMPQTALRIARRVAQRDRDPIVVCNAIEASAAALGDIGRTAEALGCYQKSLALSGRRGLNSRSIFVPALNALLHAMILEDSAAVPIHGRQVHELLFDSRDLVKGIVAPYRREAIARSRDALRLERGLYRYHRILDAEVVEVVHEVMQS